MTLHIQVSKTLATITIAWGVYVKLVTAFAFLFVSTISIAQPLTLEDYNWELTDIAAKGLDRDSLFNRMDRKFVRPNQSICSNRAHMWVNDFKQKYNLNTAKVFMFYTQKEDNNGPFARTWWYHVAPAVNEKGKLWVMDAGFPGRGGINSALTLQEWLKDFAGSANCKEILASDTDLIEWIFTERAFPKVTNYGAYDCYYRITPHTFWIPNTLAENLLGRDSKGQPVRTERPEMDKQELYQACLEATSTKLGWALGSSKKKCKEYVGI